LRFWQIEFSDFSNSKYGARKTKRPATDLHGFARIFKPIGENP